MEPAKPFEKKSELTKKLSLQPGGAGGTLTKLPPINTAAAAASKAPEKGVGGLNETKNGAAYQVNNKRKRKFIFCLELNLDAVSVTICFMIKMSKKVTFLFNFQLADLLSIGKSSRFEFYLQLVYKTSLPFLGFV